jgi:hypothetical protein
MYIYLLYICYENIHMFFLYIGLCVRLLHVDISTYVYDMAYLCIYMHIYIGNHAEWLIEESVVDKIQPLLKFINHAGELKSTRNNILVFDYKGLMRHIPGILLYMNIYLFSICILKLFCHMCNLYY